MVNSRQQDLSWRASKRSAIWSREAALSMSRWRCRISSQTAFSRSHLKKFAASRTSTAFTSFTAATSPKRSLKAIERERGGGHQKKEQRESVRTGVEEAEDEEESGEAAVGDGDLALVALAHAGREHGAEVRRPCQQNELVRLHAFSCGAEGQRHVLEQAM